MAGRHAEDLGADYRAAGYGRQLGFGARPALLVVDMVQAYFVPDAPLYAEVEAERAVTEQLVDACRRRGVPVIWTRVEYVPGGADGGYFYKKVSALAALDRGSPLGDFAAGLHPRDDEVVITKQYPSAFFGTPLASILAADAIDCCLVTGLTTSGCVRATTLDVLQHGFHPIVIEDACGDRDTRVHEANIFDMGQKYADIVTADTVFAWLDARADTAHHGSR